MQSARLMVIFMLTFAIINGISSSGIDYADIWDEEALQRSRRQDDLMFDVDKKWSKELVEDRGMKEQDMQRLSSKYILGLYQRLNLGLDLRQATGHGRLHDAVYGDTIRAFPTKINLKKLRRREVSLAFNLGAILNKGAVKLAELRLRPTRHIKNVGFYRISAILQEGSIRKISRKFWVKTYMDDINGFFCLNLTSVVLQWESRHINHNDTLEITLLRPKRIVRRRERRSNDLDGKQEMTSVEEKTYVDNDEAILLVVSEEGKLFKSQFKAAFRDAATSKKVKRAAKKKRKGRSKWKQAKKQKKQCASYEFEIDFRTLGWGEWIIEPKVFNAKLCYGECSLPIKRTYNPTNHAMMQGLMMSKGSDQLGSPCCVPSKLVPLSMLYYEDKAIVVRHHEQMVAAECGCV
ncbi:nodal homolog [Lineus longissimus]|uniref:nodal homolog n=1 Tax=Lineus longissimus TaxID=88925 RepID=UPI00315CBCC2